MSTNKIEAAHLVPVVVPSPFASDYPQVTVRRCRLVLDWFNSVEDTAADEAMTEARSLVLQGVVEALAAAENQLGTLAERAQALETPATTADQEKPAALRTLDWSAELHRLGELQDRLYPVKSALRAAVSLADEVEPENIRTDLQSIMLHAAAEIEQVADVLEPSVTQEGNA